MAERATPEVLRTSSQHHPKPAPRAHRPTPVPWPEGHTKGNQRRPHPHISPRCLPTSSKCPITAATIDPNQTLGQSPYPPVQVSAYIRAPPTPRAPPRRKTARTPLGPPRPPVPMTPPRAPTPTPTATPKATDPLLDRGGSSGGHAAVAAAEVDPAEPSLEGRVCQSFRETTENRPLHPAGGWMPQDVWEAMLANALHPQGVHPGQVPAPQDHPRGLKRLWETRQATQEGRKAPVGHHAKPSPTHRHTLADLPAPTQLYRQHRHCPDPQHPGNAAHHTA